MEFGTALSTIALEEFDYTATTIPPAEALIDVPDAVAKLIRSTLRDLAQASTVMSSDDVTALLSETSLGPSQQKTFSKWWRREGSGIIEAAQQRMFLAPVLVKASCNVHYVTDGATVITSSADDSAAAPPRSAVCQLDLTLSNGRAHSVALAEATLDQMIGTLESALAQA
eukprot:PhM_4_TR5558/c0_g1_i1/m.2841